MLKLAQDGLQTAIGVGPPLAQRRYCRLDAGPTLNQPTWPPSYVSESKTAKAMTSSRPGWSTRSNWGCQPCRSIMRGSWSPVLIPLAGTSCPQRTRWVNTSRPEWNSSGLVDIFKSIFTDEHVRILTQIPPKFVHQRPLYGTSAMVQLMPWRRGYTPLLEPMMTHFTDVHVCASPAIMS